MSKSNFEIIITEEINEVEVYHKEYGNTTLKLPNFVNLRLGGAIIHATQSNKCFSLCCIEFKLHLFKTSDTKDWAKNSLAQVIAIFWPENCAEIIEN